LSLGISTVGKSLLRIWFELLDSSIPTNGSTRILDVPGKFDDEVEVMDCESLPGRIPDVVSKFYVKLNTLIHKKYIVVLKT